MYAWYTLYPAYASEPPSIVRRVTSSIEIGSSSGSSVITLTAFPGIQWHIVRILLLQRRDRVGFSPIFSFNSCIFSIHQTYS